MGTLWIPGAERLKPSLPGGTITSDAPPRTVWHTTEAPSGNDSTFESMVRVLTNKSAEPQVLWDPVSDRLGQFFPLNQSGRALRNDGTTRTNRVGRVCIQVEVIAYSSKPFTAYWKPGPNFRNLMAAIRSWGVLDLWPSGPPPKFVAVGTGGYNSPEDERSRTIWLNQSGHFGHSQIPGNDHGDPGGISVSALFAAAKPASSTTTPTEDPMALTDADAEKVVDHLLARLVGPSSVADCLSRARWLAQQYGEGGALNQQLDRIEDDVDGA